MSHANETHFHMKGFAHGLVLKVEAFGTRKWPIYISFLGRVVCYVVVVSLPVPRPPLQHAMRLG